jgi:hypothetical protein
MKTKTGAKKKKIVLNKISIARLDKDQINEVKGGGEPLPVTEYPPQCGIIITSVVYTLISCFPTC